jgi:hypothetical protein
VNPGQLRRTRLPLLSANENDENFRENAKLLEAGALDMAPAKDVIIEIHKAYRILYRGHETSRGLK